MRLNLGGAAVALAAAAWLLVGLAAEAHARHLDLMRLPYELAMAYALNFSAETIPFGVWQDLLTRAFWALGWLVLAAFLLRQAYRSWKVEAGRGALEEWEGG